MRSAYQSTIVDGHLLVTQEVECQSIVRSRDTESTIDDDSVGLWDLAKAFLELFYGAITLRLAVENLPGGDVLWHRGYVQAAGSRSAPHDDQLPFYGYKTRILDVALSRVTRSVKLSKQSTWQIIAGGGHDWLPRVPIF